MPKSLTTRASSAIDIHLFTKDSWRDTHSTLSAPVIAFAKGQDFTGGSGQILLIPDADGALSIVLFGLGKGNNALALAGLSSKLPSGTYQITAAPAEWPVAWSAAGWADGAYRFDRYRPEKKAAPQLLLPGDESTSLLAEADAVDLVRNLVNTPAEDMGPDALEAAIRNMAGPYGADITAITGDALLEQNYPMIHAVGRAADIPPRLVILEWGRKDAPRLSLVGKGVSFDTGGLNIKTGDYMRLMKKDMGGAAHAIGLAKLVMEAKLDVRLCLLIPTVENSVAGNAFRPGDVIKTRKGLTVEIDNTDAEGRLILCDALTRACEDDPDLLIDFATLTGAARVALGPDLAPFYTDDETLASELQAAAARSGDPAWRMPLWDPYLSELKSSIADIQNSGGRMAGSITAALYLKKFVDARSWMHLDIWAWRLAKYGRPQGGAACGLRATWAMLQARYG